MSWAESVVCGWGHRVRALLTGAGRNFAAAGGKFAAAAAVHARQPLPRGDEGRVNAVGICRSTGEDT